MRDGDDHFVIGIEIFRIELFRSIYDFRTTVVAVFFFHFNQLVLDDLLAKLLVTQNFFEVSDLLHQVFIFGMKLVLHQAGELAQAHFYDSTSLDFAQVEAGHQVRDSFVRSLGGTDNADYLVNVVRSDNQSFQDVRTFFGLAQVVTCTADYHFVTVFHEIFDQLLQVEQTWTAMNQSHVVHTERSLKHGHLVKLVEHHAGVGITLDVDDDTHTFAVGFVVHIRNAFDFLVVRQISDALDQLSLVHPVRNLGHYNLIVCRMRFDFGLGTHYHTSASGFVGIAHTADTINISSGREIRCLDVLHQAVYVDFIVIDVCHASVNDFTQVVCRHIGSHTYGDTRSTVHQQVRDAGRHDGRFLQRIVEVVGKVYSFLVKVLHHLLTNLLQTSLRISHSGSTISVNRTEVTLTVDQRITHRPVLCHTHQGTIYRRVAVRVILTQYFTYDSGCFFIRFVGCISQFHHSVKNTAVNRLESVSYIREGACHDY